MQNNMGFTKQNKLKNKLHLSLIDALEIKKLLSVCLLSNKKN